MRTYGKQKYTEGEAALAYANNHLEGDKFRIAKGQVQALRKGTWIPVGTVRVLAERWDALHPNIF